VQEASGHCCNLIALDDQLVKIGGFLRKATGYPGEGLEPCKAAGYPGEGLELHKAASS